MFFFFAPAMNMHSNFCGNYLFQYIGFEPEKKKKRKEGATTLIDEFHFHKVYVTSSTFSQTLITYIRKMIFNDWHFEWWLKRIPFDFKYKTNKQNTSLSVNRTNENNVIRAASSKIIIKEFAVDAIII